MKTVTKLNINQIAQKAKVSVATVSRVINGADCVKPETRERVLKIIKEYDYVPNSSAQNLSKSSSQNIGVILSDLENPFFQRVLRGVTRVADERGYNILIYNTDEQIEKEHRILRSAKGADLAGIIVCPVVYSDPEANDILKTFERKNIPVVLIDRSIEESDFDQVLVDNEKGAYEAVSVLIKAGHRKIGFLKGDSNVYPIREREHGYLRALKENHISYRREYVISCDQKFEIAYQQMSTLMEQPDPPTAIFTSNNMMTLGCVRYLIQKKYHIGKNISVIGFDDIEMFEMLGIPMSAVTRSEEQMGEAAMEMILKRLKDGIKEHECLMIPSHLVLRGSEKCENL